jgi:hypothetical protein
MAAKVFNFRSHINDLHQLDDFKWIGRVEIMRPD